MTVANIMGRAKVSALALVLFTFAPVGFTQTLSQGACFYSRTVNGKKAQSATCSETDPYGFAANVDVLKVVTALSLDARQIRFVGCAKGEFAVSEKFASDRAAAQIYVVTYPLEANPRNLAAITHELAHVFQLQASGGYESLRRVASKRSELGADFLAGMLYAHVLNHRATAEFHQDLAQTGLYRDSSIQSHGDPHERSEAFMRGQSFDIGRVGRSYRNAIREFQDNIYADIAAVK